MMHSKQKYALLFLYLLWIQNSVSWSKMRKYCIYLTFDKKTEQVITDLRLVMAHEIKGIKSPLGKMAPHITVGIVNTTDPGRLFNNFDKFSNEVKKFNIALDKINFFNRRKNRVLFVEPVLSEELKKTLFSFVNNFEKDEIGSEYDVDKWSPHCTLAKRLSQQAFDEAKELAEKCWISINAYTHSVGLVDIMKTKDVLRLKLLTDQTNEEVKNRTKIQDE